MGVEDRCWQVEFRDPEDEDEIEDDPRLSLLKTFLTDFAPEDSYQKVVKHSEDGALFATLGSEGVARVWEDAGKKVFEVEAKDATDLAFSDAALMYLAIVTPTRMIIYDADTGEFVRAHQITTEGYQFRCVSYAAGFGFVAVENSSDRKSSQITIFKEPTVVTGRVAVKKAITAISVEGGYAGFGCADGTVGLFGLSSLKTLHVSQALHSFAVTSVHLSLEKDQFVLISGSADGTVRVTKKPIKASTTWIVWLLLALIILAAAYYAQQHPRGLGQLLSQIRLRFA